MLERREGNMSYNFILYTLHCKTIQQPNYKYLFMNKEKNMGTPIYIACFPP